VYVEMRRRSAAPQYVAELIDDLGTLTEHESEDWTMRMMVRHNHGQKKHLQKLCLLHQTSIVKLMSQT
jgi:hypothetical protein